jgi:hypothetical protein
MFAPLSGNAHLSAGGDAKSYLQMSQHTFAAVDNPFALRIMTPLLVKTFNDIFHTNINVGWMLLTFAATFFALVYFYKLLRDHFRLSGFTSFIFTLFLAFTFNYTLLNFGDYWLVDPLNNLFYIVAIYYLLKNKFWIFLGAVLLGSINKEVTIFLLPLYPLFMFIKERNFRDKDFLKSLGLSGATLFFYLVFRQVIAVQISAGNFKPLTGTGGRNTYQTILFSINYLRDQFVIYRVFYFFWIIFAYANYLIYKKEGFWSPLFLTSVYLLLAVTFGRLFATDADRVMVMMAPVVLGIPAVVFREFLETERGKKILLLLLFVYVSLNLNWLDKQTALLANIFGLSLFVFFFPDPLKLRKLEEKPALN